MSKRVLILGASGMIGRAIQSELAADPSVEVVAGSRFERTGFLQIDYESLRTAQLWSALLNANRIDAVVNCVGIWQGSAETFELVQYTIPVALFDGCALNRLHAVHISALGFSADSPLPYISTKARADQYLLEKNQKATVIYPSLVFGHEGNSTRFFLGLAALPVFVDFGFDQNLQPVHVCEVARAVAAALKSEDAERRVECAGPYPISILEYLDELRLGMGLPPIRLGVRLPAAISHALFAIGQLIGARFINHQTWELLKLGTHSECRYPDARPYDTFATPEDLRRARYSHLYWFARLSMAFLWLWTAVVTFLVWPRDETRIWLADLFPVLGTDFWLVASCLLDGAMGIATLFWPSRRLWRAQLVLTVLYSIGMGLAIPQFWGHPFGPLTKNLLVLVAISYLAMFESERGS